MTISYMSTYDPNNAENHDKLWKMLTEARKRELASNYTIVLASVRNIYFDTRYHLRAANDVRITRNGPTQETVYGNGTGEETALKIKANKNFVTTYSSYKVTTKGDEDYTSFMLQYTYMGIYQEQKIGMTLTTSVTKSAITVGVSVLANFGLKISMSVINLKLYVGATLGVPAVRMSVQAFSNQKLATSVLLAIYKSGGTFDYGKSEQSLQYQGTLIRESYSSSCAML